MFISGLRKANMPSEEIDSRTSFLFKLKKRMKSELQVDRIDMCNKKSGFELGN